MKFKKLRIFFLIVILMTIGTVVAIFIGYRKISNAPEMLLSSIKDGANLSLGKIRQTATRDGYLHYVDPTSNQPPHRFYTVDTVD